MKYMLAKISQTHYFLLEMLEIKQFLSSELHDEFNFFSFSKPSYLVTAVHQLEAHAPGPNQIMKYGGGGVVTGRLDFFFGG